MFAVLPVLLISHNPLDHVTQLSLTLRANYRAQIYSQQVSDLTLIMTVCDRPIRELEAHDTYAAALV